MTIDELVRRSVGDRPDETALADAPNRAAFAWGEPRRFSWAELDRAIDSVATGLLASGSDVGSAVAIQLPNVVELPITILACARIGAIAVPFPIQHRSHELRHGFGTAKVGVAVTGPRPDRTNQIESIVAVAEEFDDVSVLVFGSSQPPDTSPIGLGNPGEVAAYEATDHDLATICWTSGTTGTPKGVPRSHSMWEATGSVQVDELGLTADDRMLCPFPLVNMAGIGGMLLPWIQTGSALFLHQPLDLPVFLQQLGTERIMYTVAPPPLLNMLLRSEQLLANVDLSNVRAITSGSAPLDPWMVEGWEDKGIEIVNAFGSNEGAALLSTRATVPDPTDRARYFPRTARPGFELRLVDLDTDVEITEPGHPGELRFKGPSTFDGYVGSDGSEFDEQGFFRSGDIFELAGGQDPPALLRFVDRAKDIIIRGGMNISAAEVEGLIADHESVAECVAVGYADANLGERVGVFVVAAPEAEPRLEQLVGHIRTKDVASYKLPERVEVVEALPRNPVGKVVKHELRQRWAADEGDPT